MERVMDRAEARDILDYDIRQYIRHCEDATDEDFEALDLAIEALSDMSEEEVDYCNNCPYISWGDDCISRKDAIEEIALHDCTNGKVPNFTGREVQLILNNLPPVTPTERTGVWKIWN